MLISGVTHAQNSSVHLLQIVMLKLCATQKFMNAINHLNIYIRHNIDYLIPCVNVCHLNEFSVCSKKSLKLKHRGEIYVIAFLTK